MLDLSRTKFSKFDTNFLTGLASLQILNIKNVRAETIKFSKNLCNLDTLSLTYNQLQSLDSTILLLKGLKSLDLSNNIYLKSTPDMFKGLDSLELLNLSYNEGLGEISMNMFRGLPNLVRLDLSWCDLTQIHSDAFSHIPKLTKLNLSHNNLKNASFLRHLTHLKDLNLSSNKLQYFDIEHDIF